MALWHSLPFLFNYISWIWIEVSFPILFSSKVLDLSIILPLAKKIIFLVCDTALIEQQKNTISDLQKRLNNSTNNNSTIQSLQNIINQKDAELIRLRAELTNKNNNLSQNIITLDRNKLIAVNFISMDHNVHFSVPCIESDIFAEVEEKLYKEYPEYRETNNYFLVDGKQILRFKTIG